MLESETEKSNLEKFSPDSEEREIIEIFTAWKNEATPYHEELLRFQKISEQYYRGNQTDRELVPEHQSKSVENRIFEAVETITPIATSTAHQFFVMPASQDGSSLRKADKLQKVLSRKYRTLETQRKLEEATRHLLLFRFGVLKYGWDFEKDDVSIEAKDPRLIYIPRMRLDPHELPYVMELAEFYKDELHEQFPKIKIGDLKPKAIEGQRKEELKDVYEVWEVWTDKTVAWISSGKVLDVKKNPYYDFDGEEKTEITISKNLRPRKKKRTVFRNHFDQPEKPYVFFTSYRVSDGSIGDMSLAEVGIPIQDDINQQRRAIIQNLKMMGNSRVYVDSDAMSQEESENITNEAGLIIRGEGVASQNKVRAEPGTSLPTAHFSNLQYSEIAFDNIMGMHPAVRGAAAAKTLGQDIISRQQDVTRIDNITRVLNRGVDRLANGLVQLMKLFYDTTHVVKILGEEGATEFISLNRDDIEDHIEIEVRSGQTIQMDEISLQNQAVQLWQLQAIDPTTLFERLKFPNPEKAAERLLAWKQGQLTQETMSRIAEAQAGLQAKAGVSPEKGREVETPMSMLQRASAGLGGVAPIAPGTPKL